MRKFCFLLLLVFFFSCASVPKEKDVPEDMEVIDLVQKAQEAFEVNNYRGAKKWYEIILKRFGDDMAVRVEAEYEMAHILVKQKKWKDAYVHLKEIIKNYEGRDGMRLPPEFYKLAKMDYAMVLKKLSPLYLQSIEKKEENKKKNASNDSNVQSIGSGVDEDAITVEEETGTN